MASYILRFRFQIIFHDKLQWNIYVIILLEMHVVHENVFLKSARLKKKPNE